MASDAALSEFLAQLRRRTGACPGETALPEASNAALRAVVAPEDLVARFAAEVVAVGCRLHRATEANWLAILEDILRAHQAELVVLEPLAGTAFTPERAEQLRVGALAGSRSDAISGSRSGDRSYEANSDEAQLFACDAAVTGVAAAIAETGTLVCVSGAQTARGTSLIPPVHVALVDPRQIVGDLFDFFEQLAADSLPANVNMITGPSKTADIEGILITGVHGPGVVEVVLLASS
jgi:L-lactate utilization protein LutC